ncbi:hypothetical protein [Nonomuraea roseoviolacea]|uniref:DUF4386 family protein n=1 Tax=Nonomuraea roseoviolacea subsp. carminata TaxID=160689 RepID=A0ABT1KAG1_9ACTN|nr:hypothetical protein [Nonomuraea roseoviolacea]MCP2351005.1 hypothetical protein [Nonomuraea roseoviolacea subsp. carminata]
MSPRLTASALASAGLLFLLYPAVRPAGDDAAAMAAPAWVTGHLAAMLGFVLLGLGLLGLRELLGDRLSLRAVAVTWVGAGLALPYYGAEDFGLHVIARRSLRDGAPALMELAGEFRFHPVPMTMFAAGLALLGVGTVMAAVAVRRSGVMAAWSAAPLALGFALFIPQFFGPYPLRVAHGALIAAGGLWLAAEVWRSGRRVAAR